MDADASGAHDRRMRSVLAPCLLAALHTAVVAQQRQSLDGPWQIAAEAADGTTNQFLPIQVPSAFETVLGPDFDGVARYRRTLPLPARAEGQPPPRVRLEFTAVATHATVFCNGTRVGEHLGGWTPFRVDVTGALLWNGDDQLEVRVDERVGHNTQGFLPEVQPHFGGIWQSVTLCVAEHPTLDRFDPLLFGTADGTLRAAASVLPAGSSSTTDLTLSVELRAGDQLLATSQTALGDALRGELQLHVPNVRPWSPHHPTLYDATLVLRRGGTVLDRLTQRTGFRDLAADGTRVLWNGTALSLRGILHWGYGPPHLAPPSDVAFWRPQLEYFQSLGINTLKCCLFVPPRCVYELCDELGLLVWQEYPTWHPQLDRAHQDELLREYQEFFAHDRSHPSVAFRSLTCETGPSADVEVVRSLFEACKAAVPHTLVVDDSSWLGWQRVTDFWDEHPYGNNGWFEQRLDAFRQHLATAGAKPLLLGECFAADTWLDRAAWLQRYGDPSQGAPMPWWRPDCLAAQPAAEAWLATQAGPSVLGTLDADARDFGLQNRKFQIERLRLGLPFAGYVVSVARDFRKARMGLIDDLDRPKWSAADFAWQRDTMLCLDLPAHARSLGPAATHVPVRVSHLGPTPLTGDLELASDEPGGAMVRLPLSLAPGTTSDVFLLPLGASPATLQRLQVRATLRTTTTPPQVVTQNQWLLWRVPATPPGLPADVVVTDTLTPTLLDQLETGACVLLLANGRPGAPRSEALWYLRGAPFVVDHPLWRTVPRDAVRDLVGFDLESGRVLPWQPWADQFDALLGFFETHDLPEVRWHLLAGETKVGKGRLLVTTLALGDDAPSPFRPWLRQRLAEHLRTGPAPRRALHQETIALLRAQLVEKRLELPTWRFRTDPDDQGRNAGWATPATDATEAPWRDLQAGTHWENQAEDLRGYTGIAWYRVDVDVPADWQGLAARAVFDGVDDSFEVWLNGEPIGAFGDPVTRTSIWLERQVAELGQRLVAGRRNTLVLRVVDHAGSGGLWKPVFLTTGPAGKAPPLLH